jgi:hypothetical protein
MKNELMQEQIDEYRERWVVVEGFLDSNDLATWRVHVDAAVERRQNRKLAHSDAESGDSYYDNVFTQRLNLWMDHEGMRGLMLDRRIGRMAAALAGVEGIRNANKEGVAP